MTISGKPRRNQQAPVVDLGLQARASALINSISVLLAIAELLIIHDPRFHPIPIIGVAIVSFLGAVFAWRYRVTGVPRWVPMPLIGPIVGCTAVLFSGPGAPAVVFVFVWGAMYTMMFAPPKSAPSQVLVIVVVVTVVSIISGSVPVMALIVVICTIGIQVPFISSLTGRVADEQSRRRVGEERSRIARELHDVVAHHVSAIAVQAGAARGIVDQDPGRAATALDEIQRTSRNALKEMRSLVGVLRSSDDGAALAPHPGLGQLEQLAVQTRASGLEVEIRVKGEPQPLPDSLGLSAYRIVQEALTNTLKHAKAKRADVSVIYSDKQLEIVVTDDGVATTHSDWPESGHGLVGMRERVAIFSGQLDAKHLPDGGFCVRALFQLEGTS